MNIENIMQLKENAFKSKEALKDIINERQAEIEKIEEQYKPQVQESMSDYNNAFLNMHYELAKVIQNEKDWFDNQNILKLVFDAVWEEGNNQFFYKDEVTPVRDEMMKFFDHKLMGRYNVISYNNNHDDIDYNPNYVVTPNIMISTSTTDQDIISLAEHIEPYIDSARKYIKNLDNKTMIISVFEHTLSEHGVIAISTPSQGKYKIVKTRFGFNSDITDEKNLLDILKYIRENFWYEDDANLYNEEW